jgi:hypothetical protein
MKTLFALTLAASLSGCATFCHPDDIGCINRANAITAGIVAGSVAVIAGATAVAASRPVYYAPRPRPRVVYVCRWPYC